MLSSAIVILLQFGYETIWREENHGTLTFCDIQARVLPQQARTRWHKASSSQEYVVRARRFMKLSLSAANSKWPGLFPRFAFILTSIMPSAVEARTYARTGPSCRPRDRRLSFSVKVAPRERSHVYTYAYIYATITACSTTWYMTQAAIIIVERYSEPLDVSTSAARPSRGGGEETNKKKTPPRNAYRPAHRNLRAR